MTRTTGRGPVPWAEEEGVVMPLDHSAGARTTGTLRGMPWVHAVLRGQKVLARAKPDGTLDATSGRVEIRYKPTDGRAYRANVANLVVSSGASVLPDDACVPALPD